VLRVIGERGVGRSINGRQKHFTRMLASLRVGGVLVCGAHTAWAQKPAQTVDAPTPQVSSGAKPRFLIDRFPDKPSLPVSSSIALEPLGFSSPSAGYLGSRNAFVSLDFLDENRLLFTFRVPGLLHRETSGDEDSDERRIRALVLALPGGRVEAVTSWTVHDRARYVWMLKDGHFLLRDRNNLMEGDARLAPKPFLDFPGSLLWLELDPAQEFLVTNSREPAGPRQKPAATEEAGQASGPATPGAKATSDEESAAEAEQPNLVVRVLRRQTGEVILVSRARSAVHLPINSVGYIENLRGRGTEWMVNLSYFAGGTKMLGRVESVCEPNDDFVSEEEILVTACGPTGESRLVAMTTEGRTLWISQAPSTEIWPQLTVAGNGSRLAWETLDTAHSVNSYAPLEGEDVKEQSVTVFDAANGDIAMVAPTSPVLDGGGNVAISPSGRRVALLNNGAIQLFDLPAPPGLPERAAARAPK